ncbi:MAG: DNA polymerase III subunit beta, partial [Hyphomonadaceae bacterium]|nr:DNA polymerase III subunit beta [Hyphomonadaceae bacterium]
APEGSRGMPGVIVPRKAVNELARLLDDAADPVEIAVSEQKIRFGIGDAILTSKLIDGSFPQYERVIPRENPRHMRILNRGFSAAVDRVATVSAERSRSVQMQLESGKLTLTVSNPDAGFATEELEAEYNGAPIKIGFNAKYLTDVAGQIGGDSAQFEFADSGSPTLVRDPTDENCLYVLMPLRV